MKKKLVNLMVLLTSVAICLLFAEVISRIYFGKPMPVKILPQVRYKDHPERRFTLLPSQNSFTYSSTATVTKEGFRKTRENPINKRQSDYKIFALGDSFTFGMGVSDEETWPARLEHHLNMNNDKTFDITNGGTISYGVFQEYNLLKNKGLSTNPNIIIHGLYWNDFMSASAPDENEKSLITNDGYFVWNQIPQIDSNLKYFKHWLLSKSSLLYTIKHAIQTSTTNAPADGSGYFNKYKQFTKGEMKDEDWQSVRKFYSDIKTLATKNNIKLYVIIMPVDGLITQKNHPYSIKIEQILSSNNIKFFNALKYWQMNDLKENTFLPQGFDSHLNADGYEIISKQVSEQILQQLQLR